MKLRDFFIPMLYIYKSLAYSIEKSKKKKSFDRIETRIDTLLHRHTYICTWVSNVCISNNSRADSHQPHCKNKPSPCELKDRKRQMHSGTQSITGLDLQFRWNSNAGMRPNKTTHTHTHTLHTGPGRKSHSPVHRINDRFIQ